MRLNIGPSTSAIPSSAITENWSTPGISEIMEQSSIMDNGSSTFETVEIIATSSNKIGFSRFSSIDVFTTPLKMNMF